MLHHIYSVIGMKILYACKEIYSKYRLELLSQDILLLHYIILIRLKRLPYYSMQFCILGLILRPDHSNL